MTVFLCGFMGCGKTTVGKKLAEISGRGYCDTDELIVKRAGMPIPDIFKKYGEPYFRKLETDIIKELCDFNGIAACGGGAMLSDITAVSPVKTVLSFFLTSRSRPAFTVFQETQTVRLLQAVLQSSLKSFLMKDIPYIKKILL